MYLSANCVVYRSSRKLEGTEKVNGTEELGREAHGRSLDLEETLSDNLIQVNLIAEK